MRGDVVEQGGEKLGFASHPFQKRRRITYGMRNNHFFHLSTRICCSVNNCTWGKAIWQRLVYQMFYIPFILLIPLCQLKEERTLSLIPNAAPTMACTETTRSPAPPHCRLAAHRERQRVRHPGC